MSGPTVTALPAAWTRRLVPADGTRPAWLPTWSRPAAFRAVRATVVVPGLFALTSQVIGNLQMATFAAFGGFATLVLAGFGGTRRDKALAHLVLAVAGSVLLVIGTVVNGSTWLAAIVTLAVALPILFAGVAGPNAALGANAAMLAYVLPAASPGTASMIPSRLAGWWLASVTGTLAVLLFSPRPPGDELRTAAADTADALAGVLGAALDGGPTTETVAHAIEVKHRLMATFTATPYRPTGLATADQALADVVQTLEWCTALIADAVGEGLDLDAACPTDRALLGATGNVLRAVAVLVRGGDAEPDVDELERLRAASAAAIRQRASDEPGFLTAAHLSFHARTVAIAARTAAADALIATHRADPETVAELRQMWLGRTTPAEATGSSDLRRPGRLRTAGTVASRHASLRSVWLLNSLRGAIAIAAAVAIADLSNVQHGFWVVLGTLSVLRSNATGTGATALRALLGTVVGFAIGAVLIDAIGTSTAALWIALPVAVLVASYAPGTAPFAVGQAAFTLVIAVLYNLLVPVGWRVGVVRVEDVAIGCAVSLIVGVLFWPRGASSVVADDLADAFRQGARYFREAVAWSLGLQSEQSAAGPTAVAAATRLEEALRGFLAEQGAKRVPKEDLWRLVGGAMRLRLTAHSLEGMRTLAPPPDGAGSFVSGQAEDLAVWYQQLAGHVARANPPVISALALSDGDGLDGVDMSQPKASVGCLVWVNHHVRHVWQHHADLIEPAAKMAEVRQRPWWR